MAVQLELDVEERTILGKQVERLRRQGIVSANLHGHKQHSTPLQANALMLQKLLARVGNRVILLKIGNESAVQALIKKVQRNPTQCQQDLASQCEV